VVVARHMAEAVENTVVVVARHMAEAVENTVVVAMVEADITSRAQLAFVPQESGDGKGGEPYVARIADY
jgi:hypothetical protein